jgi:hypothetical protein
VSGRGALVLVLALVAGLALVACGGPYPGKTLGEQVQSWARMNGLSGTLDTLGGDARRIAEVEGRHDPTVLRTDCDVLVNDALGANQNLPTPDDRLTQILSAAYSAASAAGRNCLTGAGGDHALLARSAAELATASSGYVKAQARLDDLGATGSGSSS